MILSQVLWVKLAMMVGVEGSEEMEGGESSEASLGWRHGGSWG